MAALKDLPGEGERLKFVPSEAKSANGNEPETKLTEIETLTQQLHHQLGQVHAQKRRSLLLLQDLGWTPAQVVEARSRLLSFEEDWSAPGINVYDDL